MKISTKGRYALRVMLDMARQPEGAYTSLKELAARQGISMKYLEMIAGTLNRAGLLESRRGKEGGYRLARPAAAYTIEEILKLTEGSLAPVACLDCGAPACKRAPECLTLPLWSELDRVIREYLGGVTLADLLKNGEGRADAEEENKGRRDEDV
ncbi:MAG: Rrf2 family transcriptional regulator [Oscillospiraceae bacterium]|nr:Rrf2 family transcriptional regulator [Oscillospiraceae bacterium]